MFQAEPSEYFLFVDLQFQACLVIVLERFPLLSSVVRVTEVLLGNAAYGHFARYMRFSFSPIFSVLRLFPLTCLPTTLNLKTRNAVVTPRQLNALALNFTDLEQIPPVPLLAE